MVAPPTSPPHARGAPRRYFCHHCRTYVVVEEGEEQRAQTPQEQEQQPQEQRKYAHDCDCHHPQQEQAPTEGPPLCASCGSDFVELSESDAHAAALQAQARQTMVVGARGGGRGRGGSTTTTATAATPAASGATRSQPAGVATAATATATTPPPAPPQPAVSPFSPASSASAPAPIHSTSSSSSCPRPFGTGPTPSTSATITSSSARSASIRNSSAAPVRVTAVLRAEMADGTIREMTASASNHAIVSTPTNATYADALYAAVRSTLLAQARSHNPHIMVMVETQTIRNTPQTTTGPSAMMGNHNTNHTTMRPPGFVRNPFAAVPIRGGILDRFISRNDLLRSSDGTSAAGPSAAVPNPSAMMGNNTANHTTMRAPGFVPNPFPMILRGGQDPTPARVIADLPVVWEGTATTTNATDDDDHNSHYARQQHTTAMFEAAVRTFPALDSPCPICQEEFAPLHQRPSAAAPASPTGSPISRDASLPRFGAGGETLNTTNNSGPPNSTGSTGPSAAVVVALPCRHVYHRGCITLWLERSRLCPCCRTDVANATQHDSSSNGPNSSSSSNTNNANPHNTPHEGGDMGDLYA